MKNFILLSAACILAASCGKDREALPYQLQALDECVRQAAEKTAWGSSAAHASFTLRKRQIAMSEASGYEQFRSLAMNFLTVGPELNPSADSVRLYELVLGFRTPAAVGQPRSPGDSDFFISLKSRENLTAIEFIDKHIRPGELKLQKKPIWDSTLDPDLGEGFALNYWCYHCCDKGVQPPVSGNYALLINSAGPEQDGFITCKQLIRTDLGDSVRYQIAFEFAGELYSSWMPIGSSPIYEMLGKIEGGKMAIDFTVEK
jgi:hypothetical protein